MIKQKLMTFKQAHDWCLKNEVTVYFHPKEALDNKGIPTIGKVQFTFSEGGSAGDTLVLAVENWIHFKKTGTSLIVKDNRIWKAPQK